MTGSDEARAARPRSYLAGLRIDTCVAMRRLLAGTAEEIGRYGTGERGDAAVDNHDAVYRELMTLDRKLRACEPEHLDGKVDAHLNVLRQYFPDLFQETRK